MTRETKSVTVTKKGWDSKDWTLMWLRKLGSYDRNSGTWTIEMNHPRAGQMISSGFVKEVHGN